MSPEAKARQVIDQKLTESGWILQDYKELNPAAGLGVAVREYPSDSDPADYLLIVDKEPIAVIEAKKADEGQNLLVAETQTLRYANNSLKWAANHKHVRFVYEATDVLTRFTDYADDIIQIVREEFGEGNDFCRKITYSVDKADTGFSSFRNSYNPHIAVTVDMIATGTDVKPVECLLFMRDKYNIHDPNLPITVEDNNWGSLFEYIIKNELDNKIIDKPQRKIKVVAKPVEKPNEEKTEAAKIKGSESSQKQLIEFVFEGYKFDYYQNQKRLNITNISEGKSIVVTNKEVKSLDYPTTKKMLRRIWFFIKLRILLLIFLLAMILVLKVSLLDLMRQKWHLTFFETVFKNIYL